jgi:hypothetical protein
MFHVLLALSATVAPPPGPILRVQKPASPQVQLAPAGPARTLRFGPDIVVKEIRRDGTSAVRALVANQGNVDIATVFHLAAYASGPGGRAYGPAPFMLAAGPLKSGASQWVRIGPFVTEPPVEHAVTLADLTNVTVVADVYSSSAGSWVYAVPGPASYGDDKTCSKERGCVPEVDETNNSLTTPVSAMPDYTGP